MTDKLVEAFTAVAAGDPNAQRLLLESDVRRYERLIACLPGEDPPIVAVRADFQEKLDRARADLATLVGA